MKFNREEYLQLMTFGKSERKMFIEPFGHLVGLKEEWIAQGATQDELDLVAFDWDYVPIIPCGVNTGIINGCKKKIIEDTDKYLVERDELGRTMKLCKGFATIPLPLDYPVKDMDSWLKVKHMFEFHESRIDTDAVNNAKKKQKDGAWVYALIPGGFDIARELMGAENACLCYYLQAELMHDIINTITETSFKVFERLSDMLVIDQLSVYEDFAGKAGPICGHLQINEFIKPYYQKVWGLLSSRGSHLFYLESDGNVNPIIDTVLECGINTMGPMESTAGMDVVEVHKKYGSRLALKGGINKDVLRESKTAIRKELEYKMQPVMQQGGMVFGIDHRIPNGTPIENYRYYVDTGRELLGIPPRKPDKKGWGLMAF